MKHTAVIIGGGLGGLFTGSILSKEGFSVTVLEKNATVGGGLQTFKRFGEVFDTGMHVVGGLQHGGSIRKICEYLGIANKMKIKDVDPICTDKLYFAEDTSSYEMAQGREAFIQRLGNYFPAEKEHIRSYVDAIYRISEETDIFYLRPSSDDFPVHSDEFSMSADAFIAQFIEDRKLRAILAYMNPLYGGRQNQTPAYIHAIISVLYINGESRFVGGSHHFANLLAEVIKAAGGEVKVNEETTHVEVSDRQVQYIETKKGNRYRGDYYISAIHPCTLIPMISSGAFPKSYINRLNSVPNAYSAFSLYVKLKPESFKYINYSEYFMSRYNDIWKFGEPTSSWPLGFLMMTPPDENQGEYATKVLVTAPMLFDEVRQWEHTSVGKRGEAYEQWKQEKIEVLLDKVEQIHPNFRQYTDKIEASSPLTIRDYYHAKEGTMCGFSKDYSNLALSTLPVVTKVHNLFLTGQNNNLHGFCGVPLTAITTCEAILGKNTVINHINGR